MLKMNKELPFEATARPLVSSPLLLSGARVDGTRWTKAQPITSE